MGGWVGRGSLNQKCYATFIIQPVGAGKDPAQHPEAVACMRALLPSLSLGFPRSLFSFLPLSLAFSERDCENFSSLSSV